MKNFLKILTLFMLYFEASVGSVNDIGLPSNHGWDENQDYKWDQKIYPEDVASFLATISSITHNKDEWDKIGFETDDVTHIFKMDSKGNDYRVSLKFCCCYE